MLLSLPLNAQRAVLSVIFVMLLCAGSLAQVPIAPSAPAEPPVSITGRTYFYDYETIPLRIPVTGYSVEILFASPGGRTCKVAAPAVNGQAFLTLSPYALFAGEWAVSAGGKSLSLHIVSSIARTHFTFGVYQGNLWDDHPPFYSLTIKSHDERVRAFRDDYAINLLMLQHGGFPTSPHMLDLLTASEAQYTTLNTLAGQHQPDGGQNDWSDPEVIESLQYRAKHLAQYLRPFGGFLGVHYADEPGLTYGIETPDGKRYDLGAQTPGPNDYMGPMAVEIQRNQYTQITGKDAPDWRKPLANIDRFVDFNRWRSTILGDVFAQTTSSIKEIDPRLIGYGQVYEWAALSDGCYPPEEAKGVDVLSTHAYPDRQLGIWYPAHETDAMRSGAWNKPLWMMPTWLGLMPPDGVRACVYSTLARKVEGIVWPLDWMQTWPQAKEVAQRILPISGMLLQTQKLHDEVGIFHSRDQHIYDFARDVTNNWGGRDYVGRLNTAWLMALAAQYPTTRVEEEDLFAGRANVHKVLLAPGLTYAQPQTIQALEKYIAGGGTVLLDGTSTVEIHGAKKLPFAFADWYNSARPGTPEYHDWTDRKRFDEFVMPHVKELAAELATNAKPVAKCDNPQFMVTLQGADKGRYLWVVNMAQEDKRDDETDKAHPLPHYLVPASAMVTFPEGVYAAYDVFAGKSLDSHTVTLHLDKGDARLYALLPNAIANVTVKAEWKAPQFDITAGVSGKNGVIDAVIPLAVTLTAPDGKVFRQCYRATQHGLFHEELPLGLSAAEGSWTVTVTELLSGKTMTQPVVVTPTGRAFATSTPVELIDIDNYPTSLTWDKGDVLVLYGDGPAKGAALKLTALLLARGVPIAADEAAKYLKERPTTPHTCNLLMGAGAPLAIDKQVILVGNRENNKLIARLVDQYQLTPRPISKDYPGPSRALIYWTQGMFGLHHDILTIYADDVFGLEKAVNAFDRILSGKQIGEYRALMAKLGGIVPLPPPVVNSQETAVGNKLVKKGTEVVHSKLVKKVAR